jgi:Dyp-type peroxidase family
LERHYIEEKRRQPGIAFPSATNQEYILIIRFNISDHIFNNNDNGGEIVRTGLKRLCELFDRIDKNEKKINQLSDDGDIIPRSLSEFNFSATLGFGQGFFRKLNISKNNTPKRLKALPDYSELADPVPYTLLQTDFIIQLGAREDYINRWVFQNQIGISKKVKRRYPSSITQMEQAISGVTNDTMAPDIHNAIMPWARITDLHVGFQRIDGKNLMGFNDGISNPFRLSNNVIWTTRQDEDEKFQDGTYMVFQKIEHDLEKWQNMHEEKQELWIGRSKATGLLLGTLSREEDQKLGLEMNSSNETVRRRAITKWKKLYNEQKIPDKKFYDPSQTQYRGIQLECPVWSHVRKANPRQADGAAKILTFRRGYLFTEPGMNGKSNSGLLFICFQKDIEKGFEYIKKRFLNNEDFPIPERRKSFNSIELQTRQRHGRLTPNELYVLGKKISDKQTVDRSAQNTGRDGLSGPSELGVYPQGQFWITIAQGGGYYFIPPIPKKKIASISEQFFS